MRALLVAAVLGASGLAIAAAGAPPAAAAAAPRGVSAPTGYWLAGADGGVFAFGTAGFYGSMGGHPLASRIVGIAPAPDRAGYWLVAGDGGVFSQGSAAFVGSSGCINPAQPCGGSNSFTDGTIAGLAPTPSGHGYWMVDSNGNVFAFGDAPFLGSSDCINPAKACGGSNSFINNGIIGIVGTSDGAGYWLVGHHGSVFAFGDATFAGSSGCINPAQPCGGSNSFTDGTIVGLAPTPSGHGYLMVDSNGNVFAFGDAPFLGSSGCINPAKACGGVNSFTNSGIIGITQTPDGGGYWLAAQHGSVFAFGDAVFAGSSACANPAQACGPGNSFAVTDIIGMTS